MDIAEHNGTMDISQIYDKMLACNYTIKRSAC